MGLSRTRGVVCLVTDRQRLSPDGTLGAQLAAIVKQAAAAAEADVDLFQIRERGVSDRRLDTLVRDVLAAADGSPMRVIVNDRLDVALAAGAHGVHLPASGLPVARVRALAGGEWLVGQSIHGSDAPEPGIDWAIFGTVFPSRSKPSDHPWAGVEGLRSASRRASRPVLAIGGIGADTIAQVAAAASGIAAIGWLATTDARRLSETVRSIRAVFDTITPVI